MTQMTQIWRNARNGHHYAVGPFGQQLNGMPCIEPPPWVNGPAHEVYGPVIPWEGGDCPVSPDVFVRCFFRDRRPYIGRAIFEGLPDAMKSSVWEHAPFKYRADPANDIVAYQVRVG
jgi:hypothetical protein